MIRSGTKGSLIPGKSAFHKAFDAADKDKIKNLLEKNYSDVKILSSAMEGDVQAVKIGLTDEWAGQIKKQATEQALETIRNRIDQFGVTEPDIRILGERRIQIQLPGIQDTERAKELIGKTACWNSNCWMMNMDLASALDGNVPPGSEVLYEAVDAETEAAAARKQPYLVKKQTL
ncbi:MAG: hypothetical protein R2875_05540 [Desulfobacterales bacterium]